MYKFTYIIWLSFVFSVLSIFYVWFVTSHFASFLESGFDCYCTIFRAKVPMKINAPDDFLSKRQDIFDPALIMHLPKNFIRFSSPLYC